MVGILDNKNIAELVVEQDEEGKYLKINPETLAKVVEDTTGTESSGIDKSVQDHIDNKDIHLTKVDVQQLTRNTLEVDDVIAGANITITKDENSNNITISSTDFNNRGFLTADDIVPADDTITVSEQPNKSIKIRANIPDVSKMVKQRNIKSGDTGINIEYDENSNDVYIYGEGNQFKAGDGIDIVDGTLINTKPDQTVVLNAGRNIEIEGSYPSFTLNASDIVTISDWRPSTNYLLNDMVVYENSLMICMENHTSATVFEPEKWKLLAGWQSKRQYFFIENDTTQDVVLNDIIPNKDVLIINISGIVQQSHNYELQPDGQTIHFINPLPNDSIVEVLVMSNVVMDTENEKNANIMPWKGNTSYGVDNIVIYDNNVYVCLERHISSADFDKTKWQLICGYLKRTYRFESEEALSEVTLPVYVQSKDLLQVNVQNTILLSSSYNLDSTGYKVLFNKPIDANLVIEISVFNSGTIQLPEIPAIDDKVNHFLMTDENGKQYILKSVDEVLEIMNLKTLLDYKYYPNSIMTVNNQGTGYRYLTFNQLAGMIKGGQLIDGLELVSTSKGYLRVESGSTLADDGDVLLNFPSTMSKDATSEWAQGFNRGSSIGTTLDDWTQPTMLSNFTQNFQIFTSDYITDREGWRAMDGKKTEGNGWLVNNKSAWFRLECPSEIVLQGFDFYNTMSGTINHSKEIDVWIDDETNVVATFTAKNEDYGYTHIDINNTKPSKVIGFTIKSSYGQCCGAKEIQFIGRTESFFAKNHSYYTYILGNNDGSASDFATSIYDIKEFANHLPTTYTKYALIGGFNVDNDYNIINCFPTNSLKQDWINGTLNGTVESNCIRTRIYDAESNTSKIMLEQFGDETVTNYGRIDFPQAFSKLLYVMANGEKVTHKDNNGFNVNSSITNVSWVAKGYK